MRRRNPIKRIPVVCSCGNKVEYYRAIQGDKCYSCAEKEKMPDVLALKMAKEMESACNGWTHPSIEYFYTMLTRYKQTEPGGGEWK